MTSPHKTVHFESEFSGTLATTGTPRRFAQPNTSDPEHGQLATPLDSFGLRVDTRLTCPPTS